MDLRNITKILGVLLMMFSSTQLPPLLVSFIYSDGSSLAFSASFAATLFAGLIFWLPTRRYRRELQYREGFLVVVLFWTVLGLFGSLPFLISEAAHMSVSDAVFESMSGLTTTGATTIASLEALPKSLLYYRQQLQWLGGMGIIVLAVAIMPMLGIGGMQLFRAETPGPMKDNKLKPRITETAKALWFIYLGLTITCALAYWAFGMSLFDAICHSFSTIAIGGFSTHDASLGYFDSVAIELVAIFFMLLAAANFALHYYAVSRKDPVRYLRDTEYKGFLLTTLIFSTIVVVLLILYGTHEADDALRHGVFHLVSVFTTTGFTSEGFYWWPSILPALLIALSFIGGCAGSTCGGMKFLRVQLLYKQGQQELTRLVHPNASLSIKIGDKAVSQRVISSIWAFFSLYILSFTVLAILVSATGIDLVTAFSTVAACMNNLGPALGEASLHYAEINNAAKWILSFAMLLGRLELFTLLVLFTSTYWRN